MSSPTAHRTFTVCSDAAGKSEVLHRVLADRPLCRAPLADPVFFDAEASYVEKLECSSCRNLQSQWSSSEQE